MTDNNDMIKSLADLIAIESVTRVSCTGEAPYGEGAARALEYMLGLCESLGFRVKNCNNQVGWAEIGEGDEMVGILAHLDTVPAGDGWSYPPFALTEKDGRLYGRGTSDDKGPAVCSVYAMKDLLDSGTKLNRRIRIIFGISEETGIWDDMEYYKRHEELPVFGITPDANFPAIYGEKGILSLRLSMPLSESGLKAAAGGTADNVVPNFCALTYMDGNGEEAQVEASGRAAHASTPHLGINAISLAMEKLGALPGMSFPIADFYNTHIGRELDGKSMGCGFCDEKSGLLTLNAGVIGSDESELYLVLNIRIPVSYTSADVMDAVRKTCAPYGISVTRLMENHPVYMDREGAVISTLMDVYREETGDLETEPQVIGGGTYARAMGNIVAFGPGLPGRESTEHMPDEYITKKDLVLCRRIYRKALLLLANEVHVS